MEELIRYWRLEPPHALLLYAFLMTVCVITLVRIARLGLVLLTPPWRTRLSIAGLLTERVEPDRLATLALAGAISSDGPFYLPKAAAPADARRLLRIANTRFIYRWRLSYARVAATKGLLRLTFLVSFASVCYGAYQPFWTLYGGISNTVSSGWFAVSRPLFARLTLGLFVCIALAGVHMFLEGRLIRRKASWRLLRATVLEALPRPRA